MALGSVVTVEEAIVFEGLSDVLWDDGRSDAADPVILAITTLPMESRRVVSIVCEEVVATAIPPAAPATKVPNAPCN